MAVEARRGCGYRKVNGIYLCSDGPGMACCKLPILLHVCPTCGGGIKQNRGWTWIDPRPWIAGKCARNALMCPLNPLHNPEALGDKVGLVWIGTRFYETPEHFLTEARNMGVSRRIKAVPRGFKLGEHWVFFAHPHVQRSINTETGETEWLGGVFHVMRPTRIEKIVTQTMAQDAEAMAKLAKEGITPVVVPDDDKDHQGSVYDKDDDEEAVFPGFDTEAP